LFPDERAPSRRKLIALIIVVCVVAFGTLGALIYLFPGQKTYVVLREIPVATYYLKTRTIVTTVSKTALTSLAFLSTVARVSLVTTFTSTQYSQYVINGTVTVTMSSPIFQIVATTYAVTTSIPLIYTGGIATFVTETTTRWTSFSQTSTMTTTITTTETSTSTYTRTVWTTLTSLPPGLSIYAPPAKSQPESLAPLVFCSTFLAAILILRKKIVSSQ
jgi:hypothetical protein